MPITVYEGGTYTDASPPDWAGRTWTTSGTAQQGTDFAGFDFTLPERSTWYYRTEDIYDDDVYEGNEYFYVRWQGASGDYTSGSEQYIINDEAVSASPLFCQSK